jgi:ribosome-associated protein
MVLRGAGNDPGMKGRYHNSFNFDSHLIPSAVEDIPDFDDPPSKSQRKRDMDALQDIGEELTQLNEQQLASVELPESLRDAVLEARAMKRNEARRRQMQYVGKLMRQVDPAPIRVKLDGFLSVSAEQTAQLHHIERWRERLIDDAQAVSEFIAAYPEADSQQLRTLIRNVVTERERGKPPKHFRALFQMIRGLAEARNRDDANTPTDASTQ